MLSCKHCGSQMSGTDLVCKNCGTPWGKNHKSRKGIYFSILAIAAIGAVSYLGYVPGAKENFDKFCSNTLASIQKINKPDDNKSENNAIVPERKNVDEAPASPVVEENEVIEAPIEEEPEVTTQPEEVEVLPPNFTWTSASSSLKEYPSKNTLDGKIETAWLENAKGNGIGEWVLYSAENTQTVSSITIYNGYLKNDKVYLNNGRVKKISFEFSDGEIITKDIEKQSYSQAKNGYTITLDAPKATTSVKATILAAYQGAYYTDTGISEIKFN